jgi:hypothetical protein
MLERSRTKTWAPAHKMPGNVSQQIHCNQCNAGGHLLTQGRWGFVQTNYLLFFLMWESDHALTASSVLET